MTAKTGRLLVVKMNTTSTTYVAIGGARSDSFTINNAPVDITHKGSVSGGKLFRELLASGGEQTVSATVEGVIRDDAVLNSLRERALANTHHLFRIEVPGTSGSGGGFYEGTFMIANVSGTGGYNTENTFTCTIESAGQVTFTATTI